MAWEGKFVCPTCGERFNFTRADNIECLENGKAQVAHVHEGDGPGVWTLSVFKHKKGQRYPADARALQLLVKEQNRQARLDQATRKASRG